MVRLMMETSIQWIFSSSKTTFDRSSFPFSRTEGDLFSLMTFVDKQNENHLWIDQFSVHLIRSQINRFLRLHHQNRIEKKVVLINRRSIFFLSLLGDQRITEGGILSVRFFTGRSLLREDRR